MVKILPFECVPFMALEGLNPGSSGEGPPARELEDLFIFFFFSHNPKLYRIKKLARLAARSAFNCLNVLLIKDHHILFWKVLLEPV